MSKRWTWGKVSLEARLLLIGIPVFLWTMIPIYHLFLFAISSKDSATSGRLWPKQPTLQNFSIVLEQKHFYLNHFWQQLGNSLLIALAVGAITLFVATTAAFAISRLKVQGGRSVMNLALFTYFIPAAFLAVPMYKTMANYGLLNSRWSLVLAMVTIASPYCIWVLKQASDKLPWELDEAARMDGAGPMRFFIDILLPLTRTSIAALFVIQFIYGWNQYLWPLLMSTEERMYPIVMGIRSMTAGADSQVQWNLVMATAILAMLPPALVVVLMQKWFVKGLVDTEK